MHLTCQKVPLLGLMLLAGSVFSPAARSQEVTRSPRLSWDLALGGTNAREELQPAVGTSLMVRLGPSRALAPVVGLELTKFGSGYRRNVGHLRPDGSSFDAPDFLGGPAALAGARWSAGDAQATFLAGLARVEGGVQAGHLVHADVALGSSRRVALVLGVRRLWYRDPHAGLDRTFTPALLGIRVRSDS